MSLIVLIGAQAVGKMTVGKELESSGTGRLLFNHETIDTFARFLGYGSATFALSDKMRKDLFRAFVTNTDTNTTDTIIFTVMIDFDSPDDTNFLRDISSIFLDANQDVFFVELTAPLDTRIERNVMPDRLAAKPSKRNVKKSQMMLLQSDHDFRLVSHPGELETAFPNVHCTQIDTAKSTPATSAHTINAFIKQYLA
ncbi:hypothetical protein [Lacticaseibacillus pantheris]|uniref:hypothetical protein n=1 Tax=Lacticaseibacillus pantheris TaxID=171523 RepID=UPI002657CE88|nr:hypothetical protein [Lacticaseibacillus pantheris]WKF86044.1 hypothetical protein QY874_05560 [Lacticaseibacillus pantheris]